ncbi:hypothetical protein Vqi01_46680 [Micromonospora qiuiae]|uniref:Phosphoadenosine phosphosulphate reductase domain-containing protein n=1 Tax=Micromonospora qiuiae TaxID=502268 RepID=A0ABQ4JG81_9ACTN|nr:phosphoadenosine phosphosulfate reductase [Micromonospora qiuiae]GIJ29506.1 hypothetical protein Vqi01_46680 [Micromonospora qiuiae]
MTAPIRAVAFGGGVQSTALLVLAATGKINFPTFLFANTGRDSEDPATLEYLQRCAKPYAAAHGIELHELHRTRRDGTVEILWGRLTREGSRSLPIPVRMSNGAPGTRSCTADFKIKVIEKWLKQHGASRDRPATVGIGISLDEIERVNRRQAMPYEIRCIPCLTTILHDAATTARALLPGRNSRFRPSPRAASVLSRRPEAGARCGAIGRAFSTRPAIWKLS